MNPLYCVLVMGLGYVSTLPVHAADMFDSLPDPTRPPSASGGGDGVATGVRGLVLQSVLIAPQRRLVVINGQTLAVGEHLGDLTLAAILPYEVVMKRAGGEITLRLLPRYVSRNAMATPKSEN